MEIKIKLLNDAAKVPTYGTNGAACFDLYATEGGFLNACLSKVFSTGLSVEIPSGYVMLIYSRSGHAFKNDVRLSNCVGVIDSDYRGEIKVKLTNDGGNSYAVNAGERIAQAMVVPVQQVQFMVVSELSDTERGDGGFGSTGNE